MNRSDPNGHVAKTADDKQEKSGNGSADHKDSAEKKSAKGIQVAGLFDQYNRFSNNRFSKIPKKSDELYTGKNFNLESQLKLQSMNNAARNALVNTWNKLQSQLRIAHKQGSNITIRGTIISRSEANILGQQYVGPNAKWGEKKGMKYAVSEDGQRVYREPTPKSSSFATTGVQANFETYYQGRRMGNVHINVED